MIHNPYKNLYLQQFTDINPRLLERAVQKAFDVPIRDAVDIDPPYKRISADHVKDLQDLIDVVHPHAFGKWALPLLRRELKDKDPRMVAKALTVISDLVHDPEKTFEALRLGYMKVFGKLLDSAFTTIRERTCAILRTVSSQDLGREAMLNDVRLMSRLTSLIDDDVPEIRCKAAAVLEMLSRGLKASCTLISMGFVPQLVENTFSDQEEIVILLLETLEQLFFDRTAQHIAFQHEILTRLVRYLSHRNGDIISRTVRCYAALLSNPCGKEEAVRIQLLSKIGYYLFYPRQEIHTGAAQVMMFGTLVTRAKKQAARMRSAQKRLVQMARDARNSAGQMFAMRALTNMCEYPPVRTWFLQRYVHDIETIPTGHDELLDRFKTTLISVIKWKPYVG